MESLAELITRFLEAQRVELTLARDVPAAPTYLQAQMIYGQWLLAYGETDAALARLRARVHTMAHMPPNLSDLTPPA